MTSFKTAFGFDGRLARGSFFWRLLLILSLFVSASALLKLLAGAGSVWLANPVALWMLAAACTQRLHDRGFSGRWLLTGVVPGVGVLWLLWQFCRAGVACGNNWGTQPSREDINFLVVK
jgi:uncharacterized membrane protein YhaH (DUF805 family)